MRNFLAVAAVATMLIASGGAQAQNVETEGDLRCVAILSIVASQKPELMSGLGFGVMYFVGRIEGREPDVEIQSSLKAEIARLAPSNYGAEAHRCGTVMQEKGELLKQIGEDLRRSATAP